MLGYISKIFGGSKSEKDVKKVQPQVGAINGFFAQYQQLSNDQLRGKTAEFRSRIKTHLLAIDEQIAAQNQAAESLPPEDLSGKDAIYQEVDRLRKERNKEIEVILEQLLPEAFAVIKETARRFKENKEIVATATSLDKDLSVKSDYVRIEGDQSIFKNSWTAAGATITWNMLHYDVQLIGGIVLHQGKISEMATGEGKTLVSTLPAYLNALPGEGVHLVTVNDYLAKRDQEWNGPLFEWLGITVDCIDKHQPNSEERRKAYTADITYGTNNEFGFDYLRDNMVHSPEEMVQRKHHYAMVDEVDSVLIDDARTPLIISGPVAKGDDQQYHIHKPRIQQLVVEQEKIVRNCLNEAKRLITAGQDDPKTGGLYLFRAHRGLPKYGPVIKYLSEPGVKVLLQKAENYYLQDQQRYMPQVDEELLFHIDEKNNSVDLTDKGLAAITRSGEDPEFFVLPDIGVRLSEVEKSEASAEEKMQLKEATLNEYAQKADRIHTVQQLLKAYTLFAKDVEYVIMDGAIKIVDEQTGRIMEGRRYSDGLHQALEAKENVKIEAATQTYATITLQNYFRMYHKLAGMTGTAETEAAELWSIYKLDVVSIPTNLNMIRDDRDDLVYKTKREKFKAVIDEIESLRNAGRPCLVGTTSVEVSTERHESRRVDRQLRGRAGRQGDPGSSQFYVSLEDDLMRMFGSDRIAGLMDKLGYKEGDVIQHSMISNSIQRAQKKVEENNFGIRKRLLEYDDVMNMQRNAVYKRRNHALFGERLALDIDGAFSAQAEGLVTSFREQEDYDGFKMACILNFGLDTSITQDELLKADESKLIDRLYQEAIVSYAHHKQEVEKQAIPVFKNIRLTQGANIENVIVPFTDGRKGYNVLANLTKTLDTGGVELSQALERSVTLAVIDENWKEHLRAMDDLKQSVQTAYLEQKDPLVIYKMEAYQLFRNMNADVNRNIVNFLCHATLPTQQQEAGLREGRQQRTDMSRMRANKEEIETAGQDYAANEQDKPAPVTAGPKIGRNDPCPCGSGKKFKQCHGRDL